jgi:hypothetical protein
VRSWCELAERELSERICSEATYPLETKISFEGRNPLNTSAAVSVTNESSIQKLVKTPMMKRATKASNMRRRRSVPSAL